MHRTWLWISCALFFVSSFSQAAVNRPDLAKLRAPLVLMYHDVVATDKDIDATADVTEANMKEQLEWLLSEGYESITTEDFYKARKGLITLPAKPFLVTVDDGYRSALIKILPLLEKLKVHAAFFVNTGMTGDKPTDRMTWAEIKTLDDSQWATVYSHAVTHPNLSKIGAAKLKTELEDSRKEVETQLGGSRPYFAYPYGIFNDASKKNTALYYDLAFSVFTPLEKPDEYYNIERFPVRALLTDLQSFKDKLVTWFDGTYNW